MAAIGVGNFELGSFLVPRIPGSIEGTAEEAEGGHVAKPFVQGATSMIEVWSIVVLIFRDRPSSKPNPGRAVQPESLAASEGIQLRTRF